MNEIDDIRSAISKLARNTAGQLHREEQLTVMLFASLWAKYSGRLLGTTGLPLNILQARIQGTPAEDIRQKHLPKTKDFYPDLLITAPLHGLDLPNTLNIDAVLESAPITHIYEFKCLTSFPSLPRKIAREDTYKLKVVGEYIRLKTGVLPHMEQFVVESNRKKAAKKNLDRLLRWFDDDELKAQTKDVVVSVVAVDGSIHEVDK
jgi:hypothetical protein